MAAGTHERAAAWDLFSTSVLRGPLFEGYARWDGAYAGVHAGASSMATNFGNAASDQVAFILRNTTLQNEFAPSNWTTLPSITTNSLQYGGFIGYNWQWDEVVLGLDIGYTSLNSMSTAVSDSIARQVTTSDGFVNDVTIVAQSAVKLVDYASFRGRAGYAFGQFLPYAILGGAVGRFNYATTVTVTTSGTNSTTSATYGPITDNGSVGKDNAFALGFVTGLGMDVLLAPNVFLRGEWEYVAFAPVGGIRTSVNSARAGLGLRF